MFVLFKGTLEKHLTNVHSKRWCKFLSSTRDNFFVNVRFQTFTMGNMKLTVFCDVVLCSVVKIGQCIKS
jgi:hypothetical protein